MKRDHDASDDAKAEPKGRSIPMKVADVARLMMAYVTDTRRNGSLLVRAPNPTGDVYRIWVGCIYTYAFMDRV
jgi:hypothetical protein